MEPSELYRLVKSENPFICPELISREELAAYSFFLEDKAKSEVDKAKENELNAREEELDDYASSLEGILKTTKAEILSKLRGLCSPEAYEKIDPVIEKIYSKAERELGEIYESETPEDPTKDMTHAEIVAMMETPPVSKEKRSAIGLALAIAFSGNLPQNEVNDGGQAHLQNP